MAATLDQRVLTPPPADQPWRRQGGESGPAYEAFLRYREMPPGERSLEAVARGLTKSGSLIRGWSAKWGWVARVAAWDDDRQRREDEAKQKANAEAVERMAARQAQQAAAFQQALFVPVTAVLSRLQDAMREGADGPAARQVRTLQGVSWDDLLDLTRGAANAYGNMVKLERVARGLPETVQRTEQEQSGTVTHEHTGLLEIRAVDYRIAAAGLLSDDGGDEAPLEAQVREVEPGDAEEDEAS